MQFRNLRNLASVQFFPSRYGNCRPTTKLDYRKRRAGGPRRDRSPERRGRPSTPQDDEYVIFPVNRKNDPTSTALGGGTGLDELRPTRRTLG